MKVHAPTLLALRGGRPVGCPLSRSSSFLSFHQKTHVRQIVPSQCLAQPMTMPLAIVRPWVQQAVFIMGQTRRCCMVGLMPQSQDSTPLENPHFNMCICTQLVECLSGCPGVLCTSWKVFISTVHTGVQGPRP